MSNPHPKSHIFTAEERTRKALPGPHKRYTVKIPTETHAMLTMRPNEARTARVRAMLVRFAAAEKVKKLFDGFKEEGKL